MMNSLLTGKIAIFWTKAKFVFKIRRNRLDVAKAGQAEIIYIWLLTWFFVCRLEILFYLLFKAAYFSMNCFPPQNPGKQSLF